MATQLTTQDLYDLNNGSAFFGGGGGGSVNLINLLIGKFTEKISAKPTLIDIDEISNDDWGAVSAIIGAPEAEKKALEQNFFMFAPVRSFDTLASISGKTFKYVVPVETGSISVIIPAMVSAIKGIPMINGDGAGRAVPALQDLTFTTIGGIPEVPAVLSNDADPNNPSQNVCVTTIMNSPSVDSACRGIISDDAFGQFAGLGCYQMNGKQLKQTVVSNTVRNSIALGKKLRENKDPSLVFPIIQDFLSTKLSRKCWLLGTGTVTKISTVTSGGFDLNTVTVSCDTGEFYICSQNENLLCWKTSEGTPMVMAPDITSYVTINGDPLSNADLLEKMQIHIIASPCDEKMRNSKILGAFGAQLKSIGYYGPYIKVEERLENLTSTPTKSPTEITKSPTEIAKITTEIAKVPTSTTTTQSQSTPFPPSVDPNRVIHLRVILPVLFAQDFLDEFRTFYRTYVRPNTTVDFVFLEEGARAYLVSDYDDSIDAPFVLRCVQQALLEQHTTPVDGILVCDMFDTGVIPCKHISTIPVMGPLNACVGLAQNIYGNKFGVVCISDKEVKINWRLAKTYKYEDKFVGAIPLDVPVLELNKDWDYTLKQALKAARQLIAAGADTILLGCTGMLGLAAQMTKLLGDVPVLDGAVTGFYMLEDEVRMNLTQSKKWFDYPDNPFPLKNYNIPIYPLNPTPEQLVKERLFIEKKFE